LVSGIPFLATSLRVRPQYFWSLWWVFFTLNF